MKCTKIKQYNNLDAITLWYVEPFLVRYRENYKDVIIMCNHIYNKRIFNRCPKCYKTEMLERHKSLNKKLEPKHFKAIDRITQAVCLSPKMRMSLIS